MGNDDHKPRRAIDLAAPLRVVVGALFATIITLTIAQVFFRFVLNSPLIWSEELARLSLVWMTFLGAAVVCWDGTHLKVDVLYEKLTPRMRDKVSVINRLIAIAFLVILTVSSIPLIKISHMYDRGALDLPVSLFRLPATVGGVLMIALLLLRWFYRLRVEKSGSRDLPDSEPT